MKAILLAAGYATRLWPLTKDTPKPLLEVGGKPLLNHLLEKLEDVEEVDEAYVVTNAKFYPHFLAWKEGQKTSLKLTIINDGTQSNDDRLGSLGDIQHVVERMKVEDDVLVIAGDNLFTFPLTDLVALSRHRKAAAVALFDVRDPELAKLYGIVSLDENSRITHFEEKPRHPKSTLSSTGVYLYPRQTLSRISSFLREGGKKDKAGDFLEWLHTREDVFGLVTREKWYDIGSLEQLEQARREFP